MGLMDLAAMLGNLGEFVGAVLVAVTLIYLARQVAQSRQLARTDVRMQRLAGIRDLFGALATTESLTAALTKAEGNLGGLPLAPLQAQLQERAHLDPGEALQVAGFSIALMHQHRTVWEEDLNATDRENLERNMRAFFSSGVGQLMLDALPDSTAFARRAKELVVLPE